MAEQKLFKTTDELIEEYNNGLSITIIAKKYGVSHSLISRRFNKSEIYIKRSPKKPVNKEENRIRRFWERVVKTDSCWLWVGSKIPYGYGNTKYKGKRIYAHRLSWLLTYGEIPSGLCVCHSCDNPACVNPEHLWLGTIADNMHDRDNKGRGNRNKKYKRNLN